MAFDLCIIESNGGPGSSVPLDPNEHHALFGELSVEGYSLLSRMSDYYRDADYSLVELPKLKVELQELSSEIKVSSLVDRVAAIVTLVDDAINSGKTISAIAD